MQRAVAKEMIEAQAANADRMPAPKLRRRDLGIRHRDVPQPIRVALERVEHGGIIVPMRACLHQHAAVETEPIEHAEIFLKRRIGRRIAALRRIGKLVGRPNTCA
jgi:hypothetical protein